jgi:hypothetical protein
MPPISSVPLARRANDGADGPSCRAGAARKGGAVQRAKGVQCSVPWGCNAMAVERGGAHEQ